MAESSKQRRGEVKLNPALQARLREQMLEEQEAALRSRAVRRYVALPLTIAAVAVTLVMMLYGDSTESLVGNLLLTSLLFVLWKVRDRIRSIFGLS